MPQWHNPTTVNISYRCAHCGHHVAASLGFVAGSPDPEQQRSVAICPHCAEATMWIRGRQIPGARIGDDVRDVPAEVLALYNEARDCMSVAAYTAAAMVTRKLLMNVAVQKGAAENQSFVAYVEHLSDKGYIPPNAKGWVDHIRRIGNEATHEIRVVSQQEATELLTLAEMLLKIVYEFPGRVPSPPATS